MLKNVILSLSVLLIITLLTEVSSYLILKSKKSAYDSYRFEIGDTISGVYLSEQDTALGWVLPKNANYQSLIKKFNGQIVYDVRYRTNKYSRRIVDQGSKLSTKHFLIFGDSLAFGTGLNDNNTLQYLLSEKLTDYEVVNFAVHGYGPQQVYIQLKDEKILEEVKHKNGVALYFVNPDFIKRALGSSSTNWNFSGPFFKIQNKNLVNLGTFYDAYPIKSRLYSLYNKFKNYSNFLKLINIDFPTSYSELSVVSELISNSAKEYHAKYNGQFYIIFHPLYEYYMKKETDNLKLLLKKQDLNVISYDMKVENRYYIPGDGHPSSDFNQSFLPILLESLKL